MRVHHGTVCHIGYGLAFFGTHIELRHPAPPDTSPFVVAAISHAVQSRVIVHIRRVHIRARFGDEEFDGGKPRIRNRAGRICAPAETGGDNQRRHASGRSELLPEPLFHFAARNFGERIHVYLPITLVPNRRVWTLLLVTAWTAAVLPASADSADDEPVFEIGPGITPPRVTHQVTPQTKPDDDKGFRVSGTVLVGLVVSSKGEPKEVHVVKSLDKDIDQTAVEAVKQWHFDPAKKGDQPVAVRISVEIRFHSM